MRLERGSKEIIGTGSVVSSHGGIIAFLRNQARRDIQMVVAFLTKRIKGLDEDVWGKLRKGIKYLNGTKNLELHLMINSN